VHFREILDPACTRHDLTAASRKRALELASELIAARHPAVEAGSLFDALMARERLGSTAVGEGVAIPHCRLPGCAAPTGALLHLHDTVDFEAPDGERVDLLFVLVVPEEATDAHLSLLADVAGAMNRSTFREALRDAGSDAALFAAAIAGGATTDAVAAPTRRDARSG
jgi:PTS system nitrogen regulatory IIA component